MLEKEDIDWSQSRIIFITPESGQAQIVRFYISVLNPSMNYEKEDISNTY